MGKWRPRELLCWDINKGKEALGKDRRGGETTEGRRGNRVWWIVGRGGEGELDGCSSVPTGHGHHHVA